MIGNYTSAVIIYTGNERISAEVDRFYAGGNIIDTRDYKNCSKYDRLHK